MNCFLFQFKLVLLALIACLVLLPVCVQSQNNSPCNCTQRWTGGAHWNSDGTIDDDSNNPSEHGLIRCGAAAETQSQLSPVTGCVYDSTAFKIDVSNVAAVDPSSGLTVYPINPTQGQPIIWLNFDVRALAGYFQIQINDNSNDNIAWALYYSTSVTKGVNPNPNTLRSDSISGSCSSLNLALAGVESSHTWNTLPVPNFVTATNYYIAIWDQDADGTLWVNNFKARYGCGDAFIPNILCYLESEEPYIQVYPSGNIYTLKLSVTGINNELYAYDPNSNNLKGLSNPVCLTNLGAENPKITGTLELDYDFGQVYNVTIFSAYDSLAPVPVIPDTLCSIPYNAAECKFIYTGSGTSLPIELMDFSGQALEDKIILHWSTVTEINNDYFTVERSINGQIFEPLGFVNGTGNSNQLINYSFTDYDPFNSVNYYRLKQTDFDGEYSFSETIKVKDVNKNNNLIQYIYPNPSNGEFTILLNGKINELINIQIKTITGAIIQELNPMHANEGKLSVDLTDFPNGIYILSISDNSGIYIEKLINLN